MCLVGCRSWKTLTFIWNGTVVNARRFVSDLADFMACHFPPLFYSLITQCRFTSDGRSVTQTADVFTIFWGGQVRRSLHLPVVLRHNEQPALPDRPVFAHGIDHRAIYTFVNTLICISTAYPAMLRVYRPMD